ncbi:MAG: hypothetical protein ACJ76V_15755 [Thermoleophilaceae bacterium]
MKRSTVLASAVVAAALAVPLGADAAKPPKTPNKLSIAAQPKIITFGQKDTISGQLTGPANGGVTVQLQQKPAPYAGGFSNVSGASGKTDAQGRFSFAVQPALSTRYRAVAKASPQVTSPELTLAVRFKVTLRLSDSTPSKGERVRFSGSCAPPKDGAGVFIQRRVAPGTWHTVAKTTLGHASGNLSTYSRRIKVSATGAYRARVAGDALHAAGLSRVKTARVS